MTFNEIKEQIESDSYSYSRIDSETNEDTADYFLPDVFTDLFLSGELKALKSSTRKDDFGLLITTNTFKGKDFTLKETRKESLDGYACNQTMEVLSEDGKQVIKASCRRW